MSLITIIGRGHSGTRAISHTLTASGVFMGEPLNKSGDLLPPEAMYEACRVFAKFVDWKGGLEWEWTRLHTMPIPDEFISLIEQYLASPLSSSAEHRGWKIPETTLVFPWILRMFPDIRYIFWVRNPRDCIIGAHLTDDLFDFGIPYEPTDNIRLRRAISWMYQYKLVRATPKPKYWIEVRFEDFVLNQAATLRKIELFLGFPLQRIEVRPEAIGRYLMDDEVNYFDFFKPAMQDYGYELPELVD
jgi:hypothetical protein